LTDQPTPGTVSTPASTYASSGASPRIIALMNQKGGVGKTTTCANLGAAIVRSGKRVLLIDLDPQAHLSLHVGVEPERTPKSVYHLLADRDTSVFEVMQEAGSIAEAVSGGALAILPSEVNLAGVESELADRVAVGAAQTILRNKLRPILDQFDYVLIDCPPSLGLLTINALTLAREVVVPMQAHFLALQGLSKLMETVQLVREAMNPELRVSGVVLCMHEHQTLLAAEVLSDLQTFLSASRGTDQPWADAVVFRPHIRRNIKLAESPSFGKSIFDYAPDCHGATDYRKLAANVMAYDAAKVRAGEEFDGADAPAPADDDPEAALAALAKAAQSKGRPPAIHVRAIEPPRPQAVEPVPA
jgi:chromosome partitioning protein